MADPSAAAAELRRAVVELGFVGAMIHGLTNGLFLDDPAFVPVLSEAQDLGVPIYLHPAEPPSVVRRAYFSGLEPPVAQMLATGGWGWHAELGLHVLRMAAGGTFERFPGLQIIVGHMGENLPFSLARADEKLSPLTGLPRSVAETVREQVLITTAGYTTSPPLLLVQPTARRSHTATASDSSRYDGVVIPGSKAAYPAHSGMLGTRMWLSNRPPVWMVCLPALRVTG